MEGVVAPCSIKQKTGILMPRARDVEVSIFYDDVRTEARKRLF